MPQFRRSQIAFVGGEIAPSMLGRIDDVRYQTGLEKMENFVATPQGQAMKRPGFEFVAEAKSSSNPIRLTRFRAATGDNYLLEWGVQYIRLFRNGAPVLHGVAPALQSGANVSSINTTNNQITTALAHNLNQGDPCRLLPSTPGVSVMPQGVDQYETYYAEVISTTVVQLRKDSATGPIVDILSSGTLSLRLVRQYQRGDLVTNGGNVFWAARPNPNLFDLTEQGTLNTDYWYQQPASGVLELPTTLLAADLPKLNYAQDGNVLVFCVPGRHPRELTFHGGMRWSIDLAALDSGLVPPQSTAIARTLGRAVRCFTNNGSLIVSEAGAPGTGTPGQSHGFSVGDRVLISGNATNLTTAWNGGSTLAGVYIITWVGGTDLREMRVRALDGGELSFTGLNACWVRFNGNLRTRNRYRFTTLDADLNESLPSDPVEIEHDLTVLDSTVVVSWTNAPLCAATRIYKEVDGQYGRLAEVANNLLHAAQSFVDDGTIAPDMSVTPPVQAIKPFGETGDDFPAAVGFFEQRRHFGGFGLRPQDVVSTRTGEDNDTTTREPQEDTDALFFRVSSREQSAIKHILPMQHLLLLTDSVEYRVTPLNNDALTPESVTVRPQSYIGCTDVRPETLGTSVMFVGNRDEHIYATGLGAQEGAYVPTDLCVRAPHLFDNRTVKAMALQKAPFPVLWVVRADGVMLGLTYIEEQQVAGWHRHTTAGFILDVATLPEGRDDRVYVVVARPVNGVFKQFIERMQPIRLGSTLDDARYLDSHKVFNGRVNEVVISTDTATPLPFIPESFGILYDIVASANVFSANDVGDYIYALDVPQVGAPIPTTNTWRFEILSYVSATRVTVRISNNFAASLTAWGVWGFARRSFSVPHLPLTLVTIFADGESFIVPTDANGVATLPKKNDTLPRVGFNVCVGGGYVAEMKLLPATTQTTETGGQGVKKATGKVVVRTEKSGSYQVGTDGSLWPVNLEGLFTGEQPITIRGGWTDGAQVVVRSEQPLPLSVTSIITEVTW